jgi:hypothetical protein
LPVRAAIEHCLVRGTHITQCSLHACSLQEVFQDCTVQGVSLDSRTSPGIDHQGPHHGPGVQWAEVLQLRVHARRADRTSWRRPAAGDGEWDSKRSAARR